MISIGWSLFAPVTMQLLGQFRTFRRPIRSSSVPDRPLSAPRSLQIEPTSTPISQQDQRLAPTVRRARWHRARPDPGPGRSATNPASPLNVRSCRSASTGQSDYSKWCGDHKTPAGRAKERLSARPKSAVQDAPVVHTGNATRPIRQKRLDGSPFKVREFIPHDSRLPFGRLNHGKTDAFNRQNRTTGASENTP